MTRAERLVGVGVMGVGVTALLCACQARTVDLAGRPCDAGRCIDGYDCNPITRRCAEHVDVGCGLAGLCPGTLRTGQTCTVPGSFVPCAAGVADCSHGCRVCEDDRTWSACQSPSCSLGTVSHCATCDDDCTTQIQHAIATCVQGTCDYTRCAAGFANANGDRSDGCECAVDCRGKCGGPDGCGGTCPDPCTAPESCGGGGTPDVCGCSPDCTGKCGGADGCGGTCRDTCSAPESCGGGGTPDVCGCTPDCAGTCGGADGCGNTCPDNCTAPDSCGGGGTANVCGCTPDCTNHCGGSDGCNGTCPAATCTGRTICSASGLCACCPSWWDCHYDYRLPLTLTAGDRVPQGYSLFVTFNHAALVTAGQSQADGSDVRVVYDDGTSLKEIDRVLDPDSSWNRNDTTIWFPAQQAVAAGTTNTSYSLYVGNAVPDPPVADPNKVFVFADFFDRSGPSVGNGWDVSLGSNGAQVGLANGALTFTSMSNGDYFRPTVAHAFPSISGGYAVQTEVTWDQAGADTFYVVAIQVGYAAAMQKPPTPSTSGLPTAGVAVGTVYGGYIDPNDGNFYTGFGYETAGGVAAFVSVDPPANKTQWSAFVGDATAQTFTVDEAQQAVTPAGGTTYIDTGVASVDRVRIMAYSSPSSPGPVTRAIQYVVVRKYTTNMPFVTAGSPVGRSCP